MRIAILCPGPSLPITWQGPKAMDYDQVIAVNIACYMPHHWWQSHDEDAFKRFGPGSLTMRGICTWQHVHQKYVEGKFPIRSCLEFVDVAQLPDAGFEYRCSSGLGALGLAVHLGGGDVEIYGCDWSGTNDFTGEENPVGRRVKRWDGERAMFEQLCEKWKDRATFRRVVDA